MSINLNDIKSALVSAVLMAVLAMAMYIINAGNIFAIDWNDLANTGIIALLTGVVSLVKSLLTNNNGVFAGSVKVK
jgi:hypothetical protein